MKKYIGLIAVMIVTAAGLLVSTDSASAYSLAGSQVADPTV